MKKLTALTFIILLAAAPAFSGTKEEVIRLQSDVLQLQNQVLELQKSFDNRGGSLQSLLEQLNDQVATTNRALEQLVDVMRGQKSDIVDSVSGLKLEIQGVSVKLDETNNRLVALHQKVEEQQIKAESRRMPVLNEPGGPKPDQIYILAYNDYLAGNYELAISAFLDFLVNYPDSEYSDNAAYYLGVSYQQQQRFEKAIETFDQVINLYPKGDLTPSAYYKKALAERELQRNEASIETFRKLVTLFPESQEANLAKRELQMLGVETGREQR